MERRHRPIALSRRQLLGSATAAAAAVTAGAALAPAGAVAAPSGAPPLDAVLKEFETYAERARVQWKVPGMAIAVVHDDAVVYAKGFGVKQLGASVPVDTHTLFQIGSTSKAFTSTLVAMLVDQGKLKWTDRVIDHDPEFAMYDAWVTREFMIQDLMAQHSGMAPYAGDLLALIGFDAAYIRWQIREMRPVSSFRSEFGYVNNLFLVASAIIERLTGTSWEENVRRRIFTGVMMDAFSDVDNGLFERVAAKS